VRLRDWILLGAILLLAAAVRLRYFVGVQLSDDMVYTRAAAQWTREGPSEWNWYTVRVGLILPAALATAALGVGDAAAVAYPFLCSLGLVALAFLLGRTLRGPFEGALAAVFVALLPQDVQLASSLWPDLPQALWTTLGVATVVLELRKSEPERRAWKFVRAGLLIGVAHLHRETAFLSLAPVAACAALPGRRDWRVLLVLVGFAAVVILESAAFALAAGDPLLRLHVVRDYPDALIETEFRSQGAVLRRVLVEYPSLMFNPLDRLFLQFGLLFWAATAGGAVALNKKTDGAAELAAWILSFLIVCDVFPSRLWPYVPALTSIPRYLHPIAVPLAVLSSLGISQLRRRSWRIVAAAPVVAVALVAIPRLTFDARLLTRGLVDLHRWWVAAGRPQPIYTDPRTREYLLFRDGFPPDRNIREYSTAPTSGYVLRNERVWAFGRDHYGLPLPPEIEQPPAEWEVVYHADVYGRRSLRGMLQGRAAPSVVNRLTVYRVHATEPR
jgi:4-amino-4-deoxy-L-arabinose transferase-like glycosyltransferase